MKLKRYTPLATLCTAALLVFSACSDTDHGEHPHSKHSEPETTSIGSTQISRADGVQVAFDVMDVAAHLRMAEMMQIEQSQAAGTDRHLSITIMDQTAKQIISNAADLQIAITTPDGSVLRDGGHVMSGAGMHHHGLDFKYAGAGKYTVAVQFRWQDRQHKHGASFEL